MTAAGIWGASADGAHTAWSDLWDRGTAMQPRGHGLLCPAPGYSLPYHLGRGPGAGSEGVGSLRCSGAAGAPAPSNRRCLVSPRF